MIRPNHRRVTVITLFAAYVAASGNAQMASGNVSGKLVTESGQPLPGVTAVYRRDMKYVADGHYHLKPVPGERAAAGTVMTHGDGTFTAANLPAGTYSLCLDNPPNGYVDHCAWNLGAVRFTVVPGTNTAMKPVTIVSGIRIHFLITDAQNLLPATGQLEHAGVVTPEGLYQPAAVNSHAGAVTELMLTVPHTKQVSTSIFSRTLKFTDSTGTPASAAPINVPQGATDHQLFFTVSK